MPLDCQQPLPFSSSRTSYPLWMSQMPDSWVIGHGGLQRHRDHTLPVAHAWDTLLARAKGALLMAPLNKVQVA